MSSELKSSIKNDPGKEIIDLKVFIKIIRHTLKWFVSAFLIVFLAGILLNYFAFPNLRYYSKSHISISFKNIIFQEKIPQNFPDTETNMWLIKSQRAWLQFANNWLTATEKILQSDEFLSKLSIELNNRISASELRKSIKLDRNIEINSLNITVSSNNSKDAYLINEAMLKVFTEEKKVDFSKAYLDFIAALDAKIKNNQSKLDVAKNQAENEIIAYYKAGLNNGNPENITIQDNTGLSEGLKQQIVDIGKEYKLLMEIKENVDENKDMFSDRIFYILEPQVYSNLDFFRNIILSIFAGLILASITSLLVNIYNQRKCRENSY